MACDMATVKNKRKHIKELTGRHCSLRMFLFLAMPAICLAISFVPSPKAPRKLSEGPTVAAGFRSRVSSTSSPRPNSPGLKPTPTQNMCVLPHRYSET